MTSVARSRRPSRGTWFGSSLDDATIAPPPRRWPDRRTAKTGEILLVEGGRSDELGVVVSGRLALRMLVPERGMVTILTVEPGDLYGWSAIAAPQRATSTVVAIEPSELIAFDGMDLRLALAEDDRLAAALYPRVLEAVSRRLSATRLQLLDLFTHPESDAMVTAPTPTIEPTEPIGFLARPDLDRLIEALRVGRATGHRSDDRRRRRRLRRDRVSRPTCRPAGGRTRPPATTGSSIAVATRLFDYVVGPDRLEAVHVPAPGPDLDRATRWWRRSRSAAAERADDARSRSWASGPASWPRSGSRTPS